MMKIFILTLVVASILGGVVGGGGTFSVLILMGLGTFLIIKIGRKNKIYYQK